MSFTRFYDDPNRIQNQVYQSSFAGKYFLNTPGQGLDLPFVEDPNIRVQRWGANLQTNSVNLESDLRGLTRPLNRDLIGHNDYVQQSVPSSKMLYSNTAPFVEESRASHPAWMYKSLDENRWEAPLLNPLNRIEKEFHDNIQTRILEKDYYTPKVPEFLQ